MAADILIVDDNPVNLRLLAFLMRAQGHDVRTAVDAQAARDAVAARRPALILLDLQLPDTDGLTLTRELKNAPGTAAVPIIAVTASAMVGSEAKARAAGCDGFVTKPIDTRAVPALVAEVLARGQ